ncbi:unnamed protein product [Cercospora beticola]|nr:unnamed protein product [Cercospora beticola]
MSTKNRTYCHDPACATFMPQESIISDVATCPQCRKTTCSICKSPSHSGDCPEDEALNQLINTAESRQWQRCYQCKSMVELTQGCNHMGCRCGAQFCYVCGLKWKTCTCEAFTEAHLYSRAATIVDRNPNRRLFRPERVPHTQPIVQPPPPSSAIANISGTPGQRRRKRAQSIPSAVAESEWQSDFSDHSEWEHDWWLQDQTQEEIPPETAEEVLPPIIPAPPPAAGDVPTPAATPSPMQEDLDRERLIAEAMAHLRNNHACTHDNWKYRKGRHQCEECRHVLREYIFECRQCSLQACNRCRRNRL